MEEVLIIEDGSIPRAELDTVICPYGCVVLIEEALIWPVCAVLRTLTPLFRRGMGGSAKEKEATCGLNNSMSRGRR